MPQVFIGNERIREIVRTVMDITYPRIEIGETADVTQDYYNVIREQFAVTAWGQPRRTINVRRLWDVTPLPLPG